MTIMLEKTQWAAGSLGSLPNRSGMGFIANQLLVEYIVSGGKVAVIDKGESCHGMTENIAMLDCAAYAAHMMRNGRKCNDNPVPASQARPYYRQFSKQKF